MAEPTKRLSLPQVPVSEPAHLALQQERIRTKRPMYQIASAAILAELARIREALRNGGKVPKGKEQAK